MRKYVFDRDPRVVWETLLDNGEEMNDLVLLGVHLKSGQDYIHNHMAAMAKVVGDLRHRDQTLGIPKSEDDIVIMGDLNDSAHTRSGFRYIFDYVGSAGYVHLGSDLDDYPDILPRTYAEDAKWLVAHPQYKGGYMQMYGWGIDSKDGKRRTRTMWENPQFHFFNFYFRLKLYDDPSLNIEDMLNEFYASFYGPAGKPARRFIEAMEDRWNDREMRQASGFGQASYHLPLEFYWEHMGNAEFIETLKKLSADVRATAPEGSIYARRAELLDQAILGHAVFKRQNYLQSLENTTRSQESPGS